MVRTRIRWSALDPGRKDAAGGSGSGAIGTLEPDLALNVVVMVDVFVVVAVMLLGSECGAGEHHREEDGNQKLLHTRNRSMTAICAERNFRGTLSQAEPRMKRGLRHSRPPGLAGISMQAEAGANVELLDA
jgi:hypothetical protein